MFDFFKKVLGQITGDEETAKQPSRWSEQLIAEMRNRGDAAADRVIETIMAGDPNKGRIELRKMLERLVGNAEFDHSLLPPVAQDYFTQTAVLPAWADMQKIAIGE